MSKSIPDRSLLQILCQRASSHFSTVICNKHVTRGNCQLQNHLTLKHRVWSSPFSPSGRRLGSRGSTPSLLSLQQGGSCRLMQKSRDPTWPESLAVRQRHPLETAEELVSEITPQKQRNLNIQNTMIRYINSHNHDGYQTVIKAAYFFLFIYFLCFLYFFFFAPPVSVYAAAPEKA